MAKESEELNKQIKMLSLLFDASQMLEGVLKGGYYKERVARFRDEVIPSGQEVHGFNDTDVFIVRSAAHEAYNSFISKSNEGVERAKKEVDAKIQEIKALSEKAGETLSEFGENLGASNPRDIEVVEHNVEDTLNFLADIQKKWKESKLKAWFKKIGEKLSKLNGKIKKHKKTKEETLIERALQEESEETELESDTKKEKVEVDEASSLTSVEEEIDSNKEELQASMGEVKEQEEKEVSEKSLSESVSELKQEITVTDILQTSINMLERYLDPGDNPVQEGDVEKLRKAIFDMTASRIITSHNKEGLETIDKLLVAVFVERNLPENVDLKGNVIPNLRKKVQEIQKAAERTVHGIENLVESESESVIDTEEYERELNGLQQFLKNLSEKWKNSKIGKWFAKIGKKISACLKKLKKEEVQETESLVNVKPETPISKLFATYRQGSIPPGKENLLPEAIEEQIDLIKDTCNQVKEGNPPENLQGLEKAFRDDLDGVMKIVGRTVSGMSGFQYYWGEDNADAGSDALHGYRQAIMELKEEMQKSEKPKLGM